jgi:hypothetical protein
MSMSVNKIISKNYLCCINSLVVCPDYDIFSESFIVRFSKVTH